MAVLCIALAFSSSPVAHDSAPELGLLSPGQVPHRDPGCAPAIVADVHSLDRAAAQALTGGLKNDWVGLLNAHLRAAWDKSAVRNYAFVHGLNSQPRRSQPAMKAAGLSSLCSLCVIWASDCIKGI